MYVIIRGHCIEGENLEEMAACLFRWMPPLVPWFAELQDRVKAKSAECDSDGEAFLSVVKSDPELFPIEMQSKDSPFREI
jgi:hypothetical protein